MEHIVTFKNVTFTVRIDFGNSTDGVVIGGCTYYSNRTYTNVSMSFSRLSVKGGLMPSDFKATQTITVTGGSGEFRGPSFVFTPALGRDSRYRPSRTE